MNLRDPIDTGCDFLRSNKISLGEIIKSGALDSHFDFFEELGARVVSHNFVAATIRKKELHLGDVVKLIHDEHGVAFIGSRNDNSIAL